MIDAENAYKEGLSEFFGCSSLDCNFHWLDAFRLWFHKHCQLSGDESLCLWQQKIKPDLEHLHFSLRTEEFKSKVDTIKTNWEETGVTKITYWEDEQGSKHDINSYLDAKVANTPMIHFGHGEVVPTTNNMTESEMRYTREDAGSVPNSMPACVSFLINQAEHVSKKVFQETSQPTASKEDWRKALDFRQLFQTPKIAEIRDGGVIYHVCWGRSDPKSQHVLERPVITNAEAKHILSLWISMSQGRPIEYRDLQLYASSRLFFYTKEKGIECTCRALVPQRWCFHNNALGILTGSIKIPPEMDFTQLAPSRPGRLAKAGDRYTIEADTELSWGAKKNPAKKKLRLELVLSRAKEFAGTVRVKGPSKNACPLKRPAASIEAATVGGPKNASPLQTEGCETTRKRLRTKQSDPELVSRASAGTCSTEEIAAADAAARKGTNEANPETCPV
jgi:hypothetical protein